MTPLEPLIHYSSRVAAVVSVVVEEDPLVFLGQEFDSLSAQDECILLMKAKGFAYFLRDLGSNDPFRNHSGLFVASKIPLKNIAFIPFAKKDQAGLAKGSNQGALIFTVATEKGDFRFVNVHLNYGEQPEHQEARNRQLTTYVLPLLNRGNAVLLGDINFDTASVEKERLGLLKFKNELEGKVTRSDAGKNALLGLQDKEEKIDALIYKEEEIEVSNVRLRELRIEREFFSDHYAIIATLRLKNPS